MIRMAPVQYVASLGTDQHWNNATDKKYSRNLDPVNGTGIELIEIENIATSVATRETGRSISNLPELSQSI